MDREILNISALKSKIAVDMLGDITRRKGQFGKRGYGIWKELV